MATSGTYIFNPDLAEIVDEAFERCRMDPALLNARHIRSARRSMRFMLTDWATKEYHEWRIENLNFTTVDGTASYTDTDIPANVLDILDWSLRRDGNDIPITPIPRTEYIDIPNKDTEGMPVRVFVDKGLDGITATFWPVPENSTDVILFNAVRRFADSDTASDTQDVPWYLYDAFAYGLAARLAEKYAPPELEEKLWVKAERSFKTGSAASREYGDVRIIPGSGRRRGAGRR